MEQEERESGGGGGDAFAEFEEDFQATAIDDDDAAAADDSASSSPERATTMPHHQQAHEAYQPLSGSAVRAIAFLSHKLPQDRQRFASGTDRRCALRVYREPWVMCRGSERDD